MKLNAQLSAKKFVLIYIELVNFITMLNFTMRQFHSWIEDHRRIISTVQTIEVRRILSGNVKIYEDYKEKPGDVVKFLGEISNNMSGLAGLKVENVGDFKNGELIKPIVVTLSNRYL